nr:N-methyl-L-tryptophan oxidase [Klebsiella pneumoniae]
MEELDARAVMQRWPEIRLPDDYRAIFEPASGVLRSELAVETWIRLAREAGCAQLFNCPVSAIHHHADGITIDTLDGEYHGKSCWSAPAPGSPACFRTSLSSRYARCSLGTGPMAVTAARITSRPSPASCPMAINITVSRRKIMN